MSTTNQQEKVAESDSVRHPNPLSRAVVCGFLVFILLISITGLRHQGVLDAAFFAQRFGLHLLPIILLVAFLSRKKAWSYLKCTSVILVLTMGLLFVTGIKPYLARSENAKDHDRVMNSLCSEINGFMSHLETDIEKNEDRASFAEVPQRIKAINELLAEWNELPETTDWQLKSLNRKYRPILERAEKRLMLTIELLTKKGVDISDMQEPLKSLSDVIKHLIQ